MKNQVNQLTDAEAERLAMLAEEAAEVIQVVGKILRHGYDSYHPSTPMLTNRALLEEEMLDMKAVVDEMHSQGDFDFQPRDTEVSERWTKKTKWTHYQKKE